MMLKKKMAIVLAAAMTLLCAVSAAADDDRIEVTDTAPVTTENNKTEVLAVVSDAAPGTPSYVISVPAKIDFGTLRQPQSSAENPISVSFFVKAEKIENLSGGSVVAVLMQDRAYTPSAKGFSIKGQDTENTGKELAYTVNVTADDGNEVDITTRQHFDNGYPLYGFSEPGQMKFCTAILDQSRLYGKTLDEWAGNYKGNIRFYTTIAAPKDYMLSN